MTDHLGHDKNQLVANEAGNTRNGRSRKTLKGDFGELLIEIPRDDAVFKPFYLALNNISQKWTMLVRDWKAALNRFTIQFDERMPRV